MSARVCAYTLIAALAINCPGCAQQVQATALTLAEDGASAFSIVLAPDAAPTVRQAAEDLQSYLLRATGVELPIAAEADGHAILLGDAAGLDLTGVPWEGFRIVTRDGNLLIAGRDTADGELTAQGGTSAGTRNGVYAFLEEVLGVRWLMPGEHGDHVPAAPTLTVPALDVQDAPFFPNRRLPYIQWDRAPVLQWLDRQRLARKHGPEGQSLQLYHGHNWRTIPPEAFETHPEWFAEHGGERMPPTGEYKLCITNPEVVEQFAEAARARFEAGHTVFSLSPSDGRGWCQCEDRRALYFEEPRARPTLQVTPAVLHFYNAVAERVAPDYPDGILCGYVYQDYVFPPPEPIDLHPSVFLVWAPSFDYGYQLFRPQRRELWEELAAEWTRTTENIAYYDLPNKVSNSIGAPNPPGAEILQFIYPRLEQHNFKGVYVYGHEAWGHAALMNYLLAKLAWDPTADVDALTEDFLRACYAEGAEQVGAIYELLDEATKAYFIADESASYRFIEPWMRAVYAETFDAVERLYREAAAAVTDESARVRLERLGLNLALLHGNLRQFGMLEDPERSSFHLDNAAFRELADANRDSIYVAPMQAFAVPDEVSVAYSARPAGVIPNAQEVPVFRFRGNQHLIVRENSPGPIGLMMPAMNARGSLPTCVIYDAEGEELLRDVFRRGEYIIFDPTGSEYYHAIIRAGSAFYQLEVEGAAWAVHDYAEGSGVHFLGDLAPVYVHVPEGAEVLDLWLAAGPPGETAAATLYAPDGREVSTFDCTEMSIDRQQFEIGAGDAGWWKLVPTEPATGVVDDVWVHLDGGGWLVLDHENALIVQER
ncbi:MAG: DUF4838 domain-containing protein [Armatimonadota bacterium]|jgi:hypothetical protein